MHKLNTVLRFEKKVTNATTWGARVVVGGVYLTQPGISQMKERRDYADRGYKTVDLEDGGWAYETDWGMTAEVSIDDRDLGGGTPRWRVSVSQSSVGSMSAEDAETRAKILLLAVEEARIAREDPAGYVAAAEAHRGKVRDADISMWEFTPIEAELEYPCEGTYTHHWATPDGLHCRRCGEQLRA